MKSNDIATFAIRLFQCCYLSTKVTPLLRSLWSSPMGDRYRGVRLYTVLLYYYIIYFSSWPDLQSQFMRRTKTLPYTALG